MENIIDILKKVGAIITDSHIVYTSGKHGSVYVNKDALYPHIDEVSKVGLMFAEKNKDLNIDIVVAPALGGIILSQWTAFHLSKLLGREILSVYTEKDVIGNQIFSRGYDKLVKDKNVLVIEDIINTGGSIKKTIESVKAVGGKVVAACAMVNRSPETVTSEFVGAPFSWLGEFKAEAFLEDVCPLCKNNIPVNTSVGHGKKYLIEKYGNN
jgi:orotate phosphoribosyltransferase